MSQKKKSMPGAVLLLAALGFVLGTCEFVIVGILPEIAEGLGTSLAAVGRQGSGAESLVRRARRHAEPVYHREFPVERH